MALAKYAEDNLEMYKNCLKESGAFTDEEIEKLTENKNSKNPTQDLVEILIILKNNELDITGIKKGDNIETFIRRVCQGKEESEISKLIQKVEDEINEIVKQLCKMAKAKGKPCMKGVLIQCAKTCEKLSEEERKQVISYIRTLPKGEVNID